MARIVYRPEHVRKYAVLLINIVRMLINNYRRIEVHVDGMILLRIYSLGAVEIALYFPVDVQALTVILPLDLPEFQRCVFNINRYLNDTEIEESYYQELLKKGSATGVYLRSKKLLGDYSLTMSPDRFQYERIEQALNLLTENQAVVFGDARSLLLLIQLFWTKYTGKPIFADEKICPALSKNKWDYIDSLCTRYIDMKTAMPVALPLYLKAVSLFMNKDDFKSMDFFEQAKTAPGPSRVPVYLIHCDDMGKPVVYNGKLDSFNNGKGKIKLLHRPIKAHFTTRSFPNLVTIEKEQEFRNLAIGFNLMGPVAIPAESLGEKHA